MNKSTYRILAVITGLMVFGTLSETNRIMTSDAADIVPRRGSLTIMAISMLVILIVLTIIFWKRSK